MLRLGIVFPQTEATTDPIAIRDFAQAADDLGFDYMSFYDHVLGADPDGRGLAWLGPYTNADAFNEPLVTFGFLAAITQRIKFATGILVLPQRQTALVAKQAAQVDLLSGGRLRLAVGVGWNSVEFEALGETFEDRGARLEEQVHVLRALWSQPLVNYSGRWHRIDRAGINPLPVQRPIPIWIGGTTNRSAERAGRLGDGWLPGRGGQITPFRKLDPSIGSGLTERRDLMWAAAVAAGRDPKSIPIGWSMTFYGQRPEDEVVSHAMALAAEGVTHLALNTIGFGLEWPQGHIEALRVARQLLPQGEFE
jgi:probable F420-dependent oxidoreductase